MELASIIGLVVGISMTILTMILSASGDVGLLLAFLDPASAALVVGGSIGSLMIGYPMAQFVAGMKSASLIFKASDADPTTAINEIIEFANLARREGILALEEKAQSMENPFLKKGIMLIVDGTDPDLVRSILDTEITYIEARHTMSKEVWDKFGTFAPAWGMMGTVIGLILMLQDLDPDTLGPMMAMALITTLYGCFVANYICIPIASKLSVKNSEEMLIKEVLVEGILSIQAGENPRIIEEKLKSFFSPALRSKMGTEGGGE